MRCILFILLVPLSSSFLCSKGCSSCMADYTCNTTCSDTFDDDHTCNSCKWSSPSALNPVAYLKNSEGQCLKSNSILEKDKWIPDDQYIQEIFPGIPNIISFDSETPLDYSFCRYPMKYRVGKWFKINMTDITNRFLLAVVEKDSDVIISIDMSNSKRDEKYGKCLAHATSSKSSSNVLIKGNFFPGNYVNGKEIIFFTFFISTDTLKTVNATFTVSFSLAQIRDNTTIISQKETDEMAKNLSLVKELKLSFDSIGMFFFPSCMPTFLSKLVVFTITFNGNYSLLLSTKRSNKVNYLHLNKIIFTNDTLTAVCVSMWSGTKMSMLESEQDGLSVRVRGDKNEQKYSLVTQDYYSEILFTYQVICPNNCYAENGQGECLSSEARCLCKSGYGGDDCHLLCYYHDNWQIKDHDNLCYFGSNKCDQYCKCESGHTLQNNLCVSNSCHDNNKLDIEECKRSEYGCAQNCYCDTANGFFYNKTSLKCQSINCGNNKIDQIRWGTNSFKEEECDSGVNCNDECTCIEGYITNPDNNTSCKLKSIGGGVIAGIVIGGSVFVVISTTTIITVILLFINYKQIDIEVFKEQQPTFHYYINGSVNCEPNKESKFEVEPEQLDFGNPNSATAIMDTRFEKIDIKNRSRNKYMMIIFHTLNSPKYVFHFDPQVVILKPRASRIVTCYMTIYCTTKLKGMKIPYTVWFSQSRGTLNEIALLLENKNFETWNNSDQKYMDKLSKSVLKKYHHNLIMTTDAASSTHIDMDELSISEKPIAEGAMGRVYMGNYRSVPVAVKQFRWENLNEEEVAELKRNVITECEIMGKLRNPFIASYMGSVTYIPQVSMVIQFFILGSLGEYLRQEKEDYVKIPYKLKVRMLFDTSRGMQFLHENRIMHLDLKPDNLLVNSLDCNSACSIKITDFGTSRFTKKSITNSEDKGLGTPIYAAPETFKDEYTFAGDVYSFAITAWELYYQVEPYAQLKSIFEIKRHVEEGKRLSFDQNIPPLYKNLVEECSRADPKDRPSFDQVCNSIVKIDEDVNNHLEEGNQNERMVEIVNKRTNRIQKQINSFSE
ncbi:serine-threonine protein kinase, putative [Entamoeba invadens IP1]|uniref:Serine-threonine protein kinase, putative n=1 Tax=Entamoeba invadens IP1 TaxID=370355 RepID=A0A0A1UDK8_ENTIV|nr:serine-threonine protein kinase, putative [Entamoeba invadens IP1]ELP90365.1 serine-threonine protein kinase, putative [Entamoeba invadens IP1]|eukprot:XP_004257136.1 serine-threonine protein kinase, putative [Entamoeba invadens IP1]